MPDHVDTPLDSFDYLTILEPLFLVEPELADRIYRELCEKTSPPTLAEVQLLVEHTLNWLADYPELGKAVATGMLKLAGIVSHNWQEQYVSAVEAGTGITPVIARSVAEKFIAIIQTGNIRLLELARSVVMTIGPWGPYPLGQVMNALLALLEAEAEYAAELFLQMILAACRQQISERELIRYAPLLSRGMLFCQPEKRDWQVTPLMRVVEEDYSLAHAFFQGLEKGAAHLGRKDLQTFVARALAAGDHGKRRRFLALESRMGIDACRQLQTMVSLASLTSALNRYLFARSGQAVAVRSLAHLPKSPGAPQPGPCTDGRFIYLPAEMATGATVGENQLLYRILAGLELACWEAGTFTFDLQRFGLMYGPELVAGGREAKKDPAAPGLGENSDDFSRFFRCFPRPLLAEELLQLVEQGRLICFLRRHYPGFAKQADHWLAVGLNWRAVPGGSFWLDLYRCLVLGLGGCDGDDPWLRAIAAVRRIFEETITSSSPVEAAAAVVAESYPVVAAAGVGIELEKAYCRPAYPYGRRLRFDLMARAFQPQDERARELHGLLAEAGIESFKGDLKQLLLEQDAVLTPDVLKNLLLASGKASVSGSKTLKDLLAELDLSSFFPPEQSVAAVGLDEQVPTFWYDEWSCHLHDYLRDHVKLLQHQRVGIDASFYPEVLQHHHGLVRRIRRNFEMLRPEGLQMLRHWPEGDSFDYDALLDYAIDRRLRRTPEERLYCKRLKVERDVTVFLLIDVSSSTKNKLADSRKTILEVEKEAIVLFCEALERVGDCFAIAGFSGSGRLAAEFFQLKDFAEPLNDEVKSRIGALRPEKNTRMGPAIRHATSKLAGYPAKVKLLIVLSDGLPNDQDYSQEYAIEDCRAAIRESRSHFVHVHAVTVNAVNSPHFDRLYGDVHHTVIAEVRDLPDRLPRIYRALTKQ
ncbi:MAG: VWA domain-containing protein [Deltaproteobacteria bacterium]|nr:VWA domain-containing protein [Candidatus Anaeroferrophillus wilburensis]MBN2889499.1 VWA domain-containing protein [Deltaproteobacteria bacterium]